MKITIDLSPLEVKKIGELTNESFKDGWVATYHTSDDVCFAIHKLINMIKGVKPIEIECDGECDNCEHRNVCSDSRFEYKNDEKENETNENF